MKYLTQPELNEMLEIVDLTDKINGTHPINLILDEIKSKLSNVRVVRKSPIVTVDDNYNKLYYPQSNVSRDSRYTRWINSSHLLRTHTTSMIAEELSNMTSPTDETILLPGLVYRRDVIDKTHVGEPHQLDIWKVVNGIIGRKELLELVHLVLDSVLPNVEWRYNETNHYYTKNGIEVEVNINNQWLEILECGEILPKLLDDSGLDSNIYSGLAMGIGLDRAVMLRKNIKDIRVLRSKNPRILKQMKDLETYKEVSKWEPMKRDLSVCVQDDWDDEIIGDKIRSSNIDINIIEDIRIKKQWTWEELDEKIREKLGIVEGYKNVLLTITLSSLDNKLSKQECNEIYNIIYIHLNELDNIYKIN